MYEAAIEILRLKAANLDDSKPAEADNLRVAAELLGASDPKENRGDAAIAFAALQGALSVGNIRGGFLNYGLLAVPMDGVREGDGPLYDAKLSAFGEGDEAECEGAELLMVLEPSSMPRIEDRNPYTHVDLQTRFSQITHNVLLAAQPPAPSEQAED